MMPLIDAGNVQLSYERSGSGPPLLLIMGLSGTLLHWGEPLMERLRGDFETIVYDHRGVGASSSCGGALLDRRSGAGCSRPARCSGAGVSARDGHFDGRDDRPGAGAGAPRAAQNTHAGMHLLRRPGQLAAPAAGAGCGDHVRGSRARDEGDVGGQRLQRLRPGRCWVCALPARSAWSVRWRWR